MRIAICDDEPDLRVKLRNAMGCYDGLPHDTIIEEYSDGTSLIVSHTANPFDIVFLDIQMDGKSGLDAGREIRKADRNVIIIFLTGFQHFVFQSFKIEAFDYIVKPIENENIHEVLKRALRKHREQHHIVHFKWQDATYALEVSNIVYIEGYRRLIEFISKDNKYKCVGKLSEYEARLSPYGFFRCHQGFMINMGYIKSIEDKQIITVYDQAVAMSVRKKQDCLKAFNTFVTKFRV